MKAPKRALSVLAIGVALALAFFIVPAVTDSGQQASAGGPLTLIYYDGHMHTTRSDGSGSVADIKATALARGLDAVIITDHCKGLTKAEWASLKAETKQASDKSFLALPAFEITGSECIFNRGHMNAYNVSSPFVRDELCPEEVWPDPPNPAGTGANAESLEKWADWVHSEGGIANHNHTSGTTQLSYDVDNIEIYNQSHVDDIVSYAVALGIPPADAWGFAIMMNDFAVYGERDLNTIVNFLGNNVPLRLAIYMATQYIPPYVGQIIGWNPPSAPDPTVPGDLNSWDELLMAYVDGTVKRPTFGVANSDAHNTGAVNSDVGVAKNGLYVKTLTADEVYEAIKAGRSFATNGPSLTFDANGAIMGETVRVASGGSVKVNLSATAETPGYIVAKMVIYKNGQVWKTIYGGGGPATRTDTVTADGYYRIEVTSVPASGLGLPQFAWSNPVFVKVK